MNRYITRKIHISWFIAWIAAGIIIGIALSLRISGDMFTGSQNLIIIGCLSFIVLHRRSAYMLAIALFMGVLLGLWRGGQEQHKLLDYVPHYGSTITVRGSVSEDTSYGPRGDQRLRLSQVHINDQAMSGSIWASTKSKLLVKRGDVVLIKGKLGEGFGNIPAALHQAEIVQAERPYPGDVGRRVRDWFTGGLRLAIPAPELNLSMGYLVGQRSALPETLSQQLQIVGLTHAIVASGYNLTILVSMTRRLFARISKYLAALSAGSLVISFILITGFSPSMSRAGLIALLSLAAWYWGRVIHPVILLFFAAGVTAMLNPAYVWGDLGWYLSFAAFTGVIILAPLIHRYFWGRTKKIRVMRRVMIDTLAAQLLTLPIILLAFSQYSTYALLANVLVLPLVPFVMLLSFFAGIGGLILPSLAQWFGAPATWILHYMVRVVEWISGLPNAQGDIKFGITALIFSYLGLLVVMLYLRRKTKYNFKRATPESELYSG